MNETKAVQEVSIINSISGANGAIDSLFNAIAALEDKLEPVCYPQVPDSEAVEGTPSHGVRVIDDIDMLDARIRQATGRLLRLEERVRI